MHSMMSPALSERDNFRRPSDSVLSLLLLSLIPSVTVGLLPGLEYDWGSQPKLVCIPIPADADPNCFTPGGDGHSSNGHSSNGHSSNGHSSNGHGNGYHSVLPNSHGSHSGLPNSHGHHSGLPNSHSPHGISDEAKATILHLRESLVRQKETLLDQRETIRELTAKLTLCESFGRGHHEDHHGSSHHNSHHPTHRFDNHHGDPHFPLNGHRSDPHGSKSPFLGKHSFSPDQTGKTLQALKERLENLQARNSSSSYSSSLRDLLQRKINALEEQLHHHYDSHYGHHGHGHHEEHHEHEDHHETDHHNGQHNGHHEDHHDNHHPNHHDDHHPNHHDDHHPNHHDDHHPNHHDDHHPTPPHTRHFTYHYDRLTDHHDDHHDHHAGPADHHEDHHSGNHHDDHHDDTGHHDNGPHPQPGGSKPPGSRGSTVRGAINKLDAVLSSLHHKVPEAGLNKSPKSPDAFQIGFPMRTNYMYGRVKRSLLSEIFALTACLWLKGSGPGMGTPFSYSVPGQANELVLIEWGNNPMELLVNDKAVTLPLSLTDGKWHHLCVTWTTRDGTWEAYQDGVRRGSGENLSPWHPLKPGGVFILGQEQDTLGGRFDATQSFVGEMSDLQLWSRVLTSSEIHRQASCSGHLTGDVISWSEGMVELHGGVAKYPFDPCH